MLLVKFLDNGDVPAALAEFAVDTLARRRLPIRLCLLAITLLSLSLWGGIAVLVSVWF